MRKSRRSPNAFATKLLAATKDAAFVTTDKNALAGMSDAQ